MTDSPASRRALEVASIPSFRRISEHLNHSSYARRKHLSGICDFALGNPHQMPQAAYVDALRGRADAAERAVVCLQDQRAGGAGRGRRVAAAPAGLPVRAGGHPPHHGRLHRDRRWR